MHREVKEAGMAQDGLDMGNCAVVAVSAPVVHGEA